VHPWIPKPRRSRGGIALAVILPVALCLGAIQLVTSPWFLSHRPSRVAAATQKVREALARQRDALLAGNESAYVGIADTEMEKTDHDGLQREFRSLRAMRVADVVDEVKVAFDRGAGTWAIDVRTTACFVIKECAKGPAIAKTVWRVKDGTATLISWVPDHESQPWQVSELVASFGERTVVATTKAYESKLPMLLQQAEKAAKVADRFAREGQVPGKYVIYYAGTAEWKQWFGASPADWTGGVAVGIGVDRYDLMLNGDEISGTEIDDLLRHEMTHASSLRGERVRGYWWLVEGIAEYALMDGLPASEHLGDSSARALISDGTIADIEVTGPEDDSLDEVVAGRYAVAFLGVRCMAERFGEAKMIEFFHTVIHDAVIPSKASPQVYGIEWSSLSQECFGYVRQTLG
jgi:hypothetical protein